MYAIRYKKMDTGNEYVRILDSWEEAVDVWACLLGEPRVRILPDGDTGLDIELLKYGQSVKDPPPAFRMLSAS